MQMMARIAGEKLAAPSVLPCDGLIASPGSIHMTQLLQRKAVNNTKKYAAIVLVQNFHQRQMNIKVNEVYKISGNTFGDT
jgi:hypothetical protein